MNEMIYKSTPSCLIYLFTRTFYSVAFTLSFTVFKNTHTQTHTHSGPQRNLTAVHSPITQLMLPTMQLQAL